MHTHKETGIDRLTRPELEALRDEKLRRLVLHAWENCPGYRRRWEEAGVGPERIQTAADLPHLPLLTRSDLRQGITNGFVTRGVNLRRARRASTSGSTGEPVRILLDPSQYATHRVVMGMFYSWWGLQLDERAVVLQGDPGPKRPGLIGRLRLAWSRRRHNQINLPTTIITSEILERYYRIISHYQPTILRGYPSSLHRLALHIMDNHLPTWSSVRLVVTIAELLTPETRALLERIFQAPVANSYGATEVSVIAFECPEAHQMHIMEHEVVMEAVDDGSPGTGNGAGIILLTHLSNFVMPLIRYQVGDLGVVSNAQCSCGRPFPILKEIIGRTLDIITLPNGRTVRAQHFTLLLEKFPQIRQGGMRILPDNSYQFDFAVTSPLPDEALKYLAAYIRERMGEEATVELRCVDNVPQTRSGKIPWLRRSEDEINAGEMKIYSRYLVP